MDRLTRHELKSDKFVAEVAHTVEYVEQHRSQMIRYGVIALAVLVAVAGGWYFIKYRKQAQAAAISELVRYYNAPAGMQNTPPGMLVFATPQEKEAAVTKLCNETISKHSGSEAGAVANYYLGIQAAEKGNLADGERYLKAAMQEGGADYGSLAKLALSNVYNANGKTADAEKLVRELMDKPTILVTKDQATVELARLVAKSRPDEARKLLEPLRGQTGAIGRVSMNAYTELNLNK